VGLSDKKDSYPAQLSGGQQQRVAIARSLALQPDILLMDEPTSALDPEMVGGVLALIRKIIETTDITILIVTHEMQFAHDVADKIIFLADGVIEEQGTPEQIFEHPQSPKTKKILESFSNN
jgi:polar amino acid transport system ATP-binding protein